MPLRYQVVLIHIPGTKLTFSLELTQIPGTKVYNIPIHTTDKQLHKLQMHYMYMYMHVCSVAQPACQGYHA